MERENTHPTSLTPAMVLVGTAIGSLVCASNVYFGLQIGSANTMSASTALLGFATFKAASKWKVFTFTTTENVVVQAIASSVAGTPITASLWSMIPAYEFVRSEDEGGRRHFSILELVVWSLGVAFFGTIFSAPFPSYFLLKQRLRFPSGHASGVLIGMLHKDNEVSKRARHFKPQFTGMQDGIDTTIEGGHRGTPLETVELSQDIIWRSEVQTIGIFVLISIIFVTTSYFVPILSRVPIFGIKLQREWLWFITCSPAITAFGMILDCSIAIWMLAGAVLGWGFLSPLAKSKGWAPGVVSDPEHGVRGWLVWVGISLLLGETTVRVSSQGIKALYRLYRNPQAKAQQTEVPSAANGPMEETNLLLPHEATPGALTSDLTVSSVNAISCQMAFMMLTIASCLCLVCCSLIFWKEVPAYLILVAVILALPLCLVVMQSSGETDHVPSETLSNACQFLFGLMLSRSAQTRLSTMILAGVTEGGLWQSAVLMSDLKAAYLVQASPKVLFRAQLIGSGVGILIGSALYRLFTTIYDIPGEKFQIPYAHMWANTARLAATGELPAGVADCFWPFFLFAACLQCVRLGVNDRRWGSWVPSPVALAIGMFLTPDVTIGKFIGAILRLYLTSQRGMSELSIICAATGCVLGEGIFSFIPVILAALGAPRLSS